MEASQTRIYHYKFVRVDYPREGGYRMEPRLLPPWTYVSVTTDLEKGNKYLIFHYRLHVNNHVQIGPKYSLEFGDDEIIKEQTAAFCRRFLV